MVACWAHWAEKWKRKQVAFEEQVGEDGKELGWL